MIRGEGVGGATGKQQNGGTQLDEVVTGPKGDGVVKVREGFSGTQLGREPTGENDVPLAGHFDRDEQRQVGLTPPAGVGSVHGFATRAIQSHAASGMSLPFQPPIK